MGCVGATDTGVVALPVAAGLVVDAEDDDGADDALFVVVAVLFELLSLLPHATSTSRSAPAAAKQRMRAAP